MKRKSEFNFQNFIRSFRKKINSFPRKWNKEAGTLHLVEEIGEFTEIILQHKGYKAPHKTREDIKMPYLILWKMLFVWPTCIK